MGSFPLNDIVIVPLNKGTDLEPFDCKDADLNEFLRKDAFTYEKQQLAKTYIALHENKPIGFFSICTDAIRLSHEERQNEFGVDKPHPDYPAIKIARLAVDCRVARQGVGTHLVKKGVGKAIEISKEVACRFVTVDAYPNMEKFYLSCGFIRNTADGGGHNVSMRLDLIGFSP